MGWRCRVEASAAALPAIGGIEGGALRLGLGANVGGGAGSGAGAGGSGADSTGAAGGAADVPVAVAGANDCSPFIDTAKTDAQIAQRARTPPAGTFAGSTR